MKFPYSPVIRTLAALGVAASLSAVSVPALSQSQTGNGSSATTDDNTRQQHLRERLQSRLDEMAKRLQIDARQQDAWNEYSKTLQSTFETKPERAATDTDTDAATIVRQRAAMAATHAQKLTQLADATAKLQEVLTLEQRKTLIEIVQQHGRSPDEHPMRHRNGQPRTP